MFAAWTLGSTRVGIGLLMSVVLRLMGTGLIERGRRDSLLIGRVQLAGGNAAEN